MPYINFKTNVKIENPAQMQAKFGKVITIIPGKLPERTMMSIEGNCKMFFENNEDPCAMVETLVNKETDMSTLTEYSQAVIKMIVDTLGVSEKRIYVTVNKMDNWYSIKPKT